MSLIEILLVFTLLITIYNIFVRKKYHLPPGPVEFPLIGSLLTILLAGVSQAPILFMKIGKKYGDIFKLRTGMVTHVIFNSSEAIMEISNNDEFTSHIDESDHFILTKTHGKVAGLIFGNDQTWLDTRAHCKKLIRKYGFFGKYGLENLIQEEIRDLFDDIKETCHKDPNGVLIEIDNQFCTIFFNVTWTIMTGRRFPKEDPLLKDLVLYTNAFLRSGGFGQGVNGIYPKLLNWFPNLTGYTHMKDLCEKWVKTIKSILEEYRKDGSYMHKPLNFIEEFLKEVDLNRNSAFPQPMFTEINLIAVIEDFLLGGVDTQSCLLKFIIRLFAMDTNIQDQVRKEVFRVVGRSRMATADDIPNLTYVQAVIWETMRRSTPIPVVPRKIRKDVKVLQYDFPKGTQVILNLFAANHQETIWKDPYEYKPERFINDSGELVNTEKVLSFGIGKRRCIGEFFAKVDLTLIVATIVQEFEISKPENIGLPTDLEIKYAFTSDFSPFPVVFRLRD